MVHTAWVLQPPHNATFQDKDRHPQFHLQFLVDRLDGTSLFSATTGDLTNSRDVNDGKTVTWRVIKTSEY